MVEASTYFTPHEARRLAEVVGDFRRIVIQDQQEPGAAARNRPHRKHLAELIRETLLTAEIPPGEALVFGDFAVSLAVDEDGVSSLRKSFLSIRLRGRS